MSRITFVTLALAACVAAVSAFGPHNLEQAITGSWKVETINFDFIPANFSRITQRLDNFNPQNNATFEQRFVSDSQYYRAGGPIYVILSSLGPISAYDLIETLIASVARTEHAHMFILENRYYGESIPTADLSVENLQYLTVEQALADTANFIRHIKSTTPGAENSPVILAGRHYGGSLAVWFRQKYPHLTAGVWASSAPLQSLHNHQQYMVNAAATIRELAGVECYNVIDAGFDELEAIAVEGRLAELNKLFNVCEEHPLESNNDVATLFLILSDLFSSISTLRPAMDTFCDILVQNVNSTPSEAIAAVMQNINGGYCLVVDYEAFIRYESQIEANTTFAYSGIRQTTYQLCTQLGWFSTSESPDQPFGSFFPLAFYTNICVRLFGEEVAGHEIAQANQDRFNVEHGGLNPWISNALFTYGEWDASRSIGVTRNLAESAVALGIPESGRAYDFYAIHMYDKQYLIDAKLDIMAAIREWAK